MGEIIHSKTIPNKTAKYKISLDQKEIYNLKGHLKNIHLFSSKLCSHNSQINTRGNKGVTKYFKIPLNIRSRKKPTGKLSYQKIDTPTKTYYVYILKKEPEIK